MRRSTGRLAIACGCAFATAVFTGAALAGNGHGNDSAPGQQKQDGAAASQPAPAQPAAPSEQSQSPQTQSPQTQSSQTQSEQSRQQHSSPGQAKKDAASSTTGSQPGVKPGSSTTHWTHCTTGGSGTGSATCTAQAGTPDVKADVSKRYGNGGTAAQIAVGRGAPDGTLITGPGNSQPHKVTACGKPGNRSGGVDVHAIKSYDASACQPQPAPPVAIASQAPVAAHVAPSPAVTTPVADAPIGVAPVSVAPVSAAPVSVAPVTGTTVTVSSAATPPARNVGGVLGASATIPKAKAAPTGGLLGTASKVAGSTLPFTGFPVGVAVLIALGLIAAGLTLRRRGGTMQR